MTEDHWNREAILENIFNIRHRISEAAQSACQSPDSIMLMAVTKMVPPEAINLAWEGGIRLFGENRAQELLERYDRYCFKAQDIHFIGHLQTNKVRQIVDKVSCIQSVDSLHLVLEIATRSAAIGKTMPIMLEVNIGNERSKTGFLPAEVEGALENIALLEGVSVCGLMTIPPVWEKSEETPLYFDQMYKLFVDIKHKKIDNVSMEYLSMGMSGDYETAIRAGANLVRIGSGIFGRRLY